MAPSALPTAYDTLNWAGVAAGAVLLGSLVSWHWPKTGAKHWHKGARHTFELAVARQRLNASATNSLQRRGASVQPAGQQI